MKVLVTKPILDQLERDLGVKFTQVTGSLSSSGNFLEIETNHISFYRLLKRLAHAYIRTYNKEHPKG